MLDKVGVAPPEAAHTEVKKRKADQALGEDGGRDVDEQDPMEQDELMAGACPNLPPDEFEHEAGAGVEGVRGGEFDEVQAGTQAQVDGVREQNATCKQAGVLDPHAQDFMHGVASSSAGARGGSQACG